MLRTLTSVIDILTAMHHLVWRAARSHALAPHAEPYAPQRARPELHFQQHTKHTQNPSCTHGIAQSMHSSIPARARKPGASSTTSPLFDYFEVRQRFSLQGPLAPKQKSQKTAFAAPTTLASLATHLAPFTLAAPLTLVALATLMAEADATSWPTPAHLSLALLPLHALRRRHSPLSQTRELGTHLFSLSLLPLPLSHSLSHAFSLSLSLSHPLTLSHSLPLPLTLSPTSGSSTKALLRLYLIQHVKNNIACQK